MIKRYLIQKRLQPWYVNDYRRLKASNSPVFKQSLSFGSEGLTTPAIVSATHQLVSISRIAPSSPTTVIIVTRLVTVPSLPTSTVDVLPSGSQMPANGTLNRSSSPLGATGIIAIVLGLLLGMVLCFILFRSSSISGMKTRAGNILRDKYISESYIATRRRLRS